MKEDGKTELNGVVNSLVNIIEGELKMKLLMQDPHGNLVWQDAIYKNARFRDPNESRSYEITQIYAVQDDDRNNTVICSACGKEIPNTTAAKNAHQNIINRTDKCFGCQYMHTDVRTTLSRKYVVNEDGTYTESTKRQVELTCGNFWRSHPAINTDEANRGCRHSACQIAEFRAIEDFWTKYPGAFDEFITTDSLIDAGYSNTHRRGDVLSFDLSGQIELFANVNLQGICTDFTMMFHRQRFLIRYSKKYDKLFVVDCGRFRDLSTIDMSDRTQKTILRKIKALYV